MAKQKKASGTDLILYLIVMAFLFIVALLYVVVKVGVTVVFWGLPVFAVLGYRFHARTPRSPPAIPDPALFDSQDATRVVSLLVAERNQWISMRQKQYVTGKESGLYLTQNSEETRFDMRSRLGRELNNNLDTAEASISRVNSEIEQVRTNIADTLPAWHQEFDKWVKMRALGLACIPATITLPIAFLGLYFFWASHAPDPLQSLQKLLLWNPFPPTISLGTLVGAVLATYAVYGIAIPVYRKRLARTLDADIVERWSRLISKWSPRTPVTLFFTADASGTNESSRENQNKSTSTRNETWQEVLGVKQGALVDEVKAAYRERMKGYHSDRVFGLGQKLQDLAEEESKMINLAYDEAKASMGFH